MALTFDLEVSGSRQHVLVRGAAASLPPMVVLHGGPGISETALFRAFVPELERHFLMVYWDQRGAGRSFSSDIPAATMTVDNFVRDLDQVVREVQRLFGDRPVYLLGHSWGTVIGTLYAERHPEQVAAYVGVAQVADYPRAERTSWDWAMERAVESDRLRLLRRLQQIGPPPHGVDQMLALRKAVEQLGGSFHAGLSTGGLIRAALTRGGAGLGDLVRFGSGNRFSLEALWPELRELRLTEVRRFDVPVFILLGRHDMQVPAVVAAEYFASIEAPCKRLYWFEDAAHHVPFEAPDTFVEIVTGDIPARVDSAQCDDLR